jgi:hypothetical protein
MWFAPAGDFDNIIADLGGQIAAEEDRTKIKDESHPAYSTFAMAAAKRARICSFQRHTPNQCSM